jgi:hypothetical protein
MMDDNVFYYEKQHFRQWWLWILMAGVNLIFIAECVEQLFRGRPFGNNPTSDAGLITVSAIVFIFTALFFYVTLNTVLDKEGIFVWFYPVQIRKKYFSWEEIDRVYIRKYSPVRNMAAGDAGPDPDTDREAEADTGMNSVAVLRTEKRIICPGISACRLF